MFFQVFSNNSSESKSIYALAFTRAAYYISDESFSGTIIYDINELVSLAEESKIIDVSFVDIAPPNAVKTVEEFRQNHPETMLAIIADASIIPTVYLKPTIMASSLLLRPFEKEQILSVVNELFLTYSDAKQNEEDVIAIKTIDGNIRIPYRDILYFEARDKKIFVRTQYEEYPFYSTIEKLRESVPRYFSQCHRSFLINRKKIQKIVFAENTVILEGDNFVPLSRGCKNEAKGWIGK